MWLKYAMKELSRNVIGIQLAKKLGEELKLDWSKYDLEEFRMGIEEELEHKGVTHGDLKMTARIALDHLNEDPNYYTKLKSVMD
jgi:hypothetical protein